jgi:hypothetical protein
VNVLQGKILSPLLSNIYLHEFDVCIKNLAASHCNWTAKPQTIDFFKYLKKCPSKGQAESPNPKEHPTLFLAQNNPSNLTAKILSMIDFLQKEPMAS